MDIRYNQKLNLYESILQCKDSQEAKALFTIHLQAKYNFTIKLRALDDQLFELNGASKEDLINAANDLNQLLYLKKG